MENQTYYFDGEFVEDFEDPVGIKFELNSGPNFVDISGKDVRDILVELRREFAGIFSGPEALVNSWVTLAREIEGTCTWFFFVEVVEDIPGYTYQKKWCWSWWDCTDFLRPNFMVTSREEK